MAIARVGRESSSRDLLIVMPTTKQWGKVEVGLGFGNNPESWFFPHFSGQRLFWLEIDLQKMLTASPLISWVLEKFQGFLAFLDFLAKYCVNIWRTIGSFGVGTICNHIQHINKSDARTCNPWCAHDMLMKLSGAPCGTILWQLHFKLMIVSASFPLA